MRVLCGQCGHTFETPNAQADGVVPCPRCAREIPVQAAKDAAPGQPTSQAEAPSQEDEGFAAEAKHVIARRIRVTCGSCGRRLFLAMRRAGKRVRCPSCGKRIQIPDLDQQDEIELARWTFLARTDADQLDIAETEQPQAEVQPETGGEALRELDDLEEVPVELVEAPVAPVRRKRSLPLAGIVVAVIAGSVLLGLWLKLRPTDGRPTTAEPGASEPSTQTSRPVAGVTPLPPGTDSSPQPKPALPAQCELLGVTTDVFAAAGYFPARPGRLYWKVTVGLAAGTEPLSFKTYGEDAVLAVGDQWHVCLGEPVEITSLPVSSRQRQVRLEPRSSEDLTLLFEVPSSARSGKLKIAGLKPIEVFGVPVPQDPPGRALVGTYGEAAPRNLKPLLRHPVMAAIQAASDQELIVRNRAGAFEITIPQASVTGSARAGRGVYDAVLGCGGSQLDCKLRLLEDGNLLILYLSDEPFHQMTYRRRWEYPTGGL